MKANRIILGGLIAASVVAASGCATILNDENQSINVTSSTGEADTA